MRVVLAATLLLLAHPSHGQSTEELQQLLKERDAEIRALRDRLAALEKPEADDELSRALERTLIQQGALVLPARTYEVEPQIAYAHWDRDRGPLRYEWDGEVALRAGIGWQSQVQLRIPYVHAATATDSVTGLGDVSLQVLKQLTREEGLRPGLFASLGWLSRTGKDSLSGGVPAGGGFNVPQVALTAVKRHDPLVYFGGVSYATPRPREVAGLRVQPGNTVGVRGGAVLAATPDTSVNVGLNLGFGGATQVNGERISDSDTVSATLQLGFGTVLSRSMMLNVSGEFRVSGVAPNFRLVLGLPIRF
jgi:hypothetical protein